MKTDNQIFFLSTFYELKIYLNVCYPCPFFRFDKFWSTRFFFVLIENCVMMCKKVYFYMVLQYNDHDFLFVLYMSNIYSSRLTEWVKRTNRFIEELRSWKFEIFVKIYIFFSVFICVISHSHIIFLSLIRTFSLSLSLAFILYKLNF